MIGRDSFLHAVAVVAWLLLCLAGCQEQRPAGGKGQQAPQARPVVALDVLVIDDPEVAAGIHRLRGEWAERSGGRLLVHEWKMADLIDAMAKPEPSLPADVVIYPSRAVGTLVAGDTLRPVRKAVLADPRLSLADLLPAVRNREIMFGGQAIALPLGSPPLMLCFNPQMLTKLHGAVPATWEDYRQLASKLQQQGKPCVLPLLGNAAAVTLLARAAGYADRGGGDGLLFDAATFAPRIAEPPFVRALDEIVEELAPHGHALEQSLSCDFAGAVAEVAAGRAVIAFGWPGASRSRAAEVATGVAASKVGVGFAELPRAKQVFSTTREQWIANRIETPVTLLGAAGRLASVTTASRNAVSAFKLLTWLCSGKTATQISSRSPATLWHRGSQLGNAGRWLGQANEATHSDQRAIARTAAEALSRSDCVQIPRIPGIDQYLAVLGAAVRRAASGENPEAALQQTAQAWEKITQQHGRQRQHTAYRQHLGL